MRHLTNSEIGQFSDLLKAIFRTRNRLADFLQFRLGRTYEHFERREDTVPDVIVHLVDDASSFLWWDDLLREARNIVPGDVGLAQFATQFGMAPGIVAPSLTGVAPVQGPQLELKIQQSQSTYNIVEWRQRLGEIEGRVCRIEYPNNVARGTGFLVGPNAVLTNYHVIEAIERCDYPPSTVRLRFDYKVLDDGVAVQRGLVFALERDWLYDASPYSVEDGKVDPADPTPEELDYAILRVKGEPGNQPLGGKTGESDPKAIQRGWIDAAGTAHDFLAQRALYIVQHPDGSPMQVAIDSNAVIGTNGNGTRVRYTTTTQPGSSGSPCFGPDWSWVALHHSGDPKYVLGQMPQFNQGVPLAAIEALLQKRNKQHVFGGII
jgi:Trypsin-like peptidase domain/Effector-associated domain 1